MNTNKPAHPECTLALGGVGAWVDARLLLPSCVSLLVFLSSLFPFPFARPSLAFLTRFLPRLAPIAPSPIAHRPVRPSHPPPPTTTTSCPRPSTHPPPCPNTARQTRTGGHSSQDTNSPLPTRAPPQARPPPLKARRSNSNSNPSTLALTASTRPPSYQPRSRTPRQLQRALQHQVHQVETQLAHAVQALRP